MHTILTHWSADNILANKKIHEYTQAKIEERWKSARYRRVWYYFFEKEIEQDTQKELKISLFSEQMTLRDPEYQALIARASSQYTTSGDEIFRDEATLMCNNYIFWQDIFSGSDEENDFLFTQQLIDLIVSGNGPGFVTNSSYWMSDVLLQVRRARADVQLVHNIVSWEYTYKTLLKACGNYIGTFAMLPRFVELLGTGWNTDTLLSVFEESQQLQLHVILEPSYQISCALLSNADVQPYGYVDIIHSPYSHVISRFGARWSQRPRYLKLLLVLSIIIVSGWIWWTSLFILPVVRWLFALARTSWQYLALLQNAFSTWYRHYQSQHMNYLNLYDNMIDPDMSVQKSSKAQHFMNRRYDIIPFAWHELVWDAKQYAKILYETILSMVTKNDFSSKNIAMISAVRQRWQDHNLSLLIVKDGQYTEQILYRFEQLLWLAKQITFDSFDQSHYTETYELIDDLVSTKKYHFRFWTFRNALWDGVVVGISSGVIGWLWSYLRNRWITGSSALAAGPWMIPHAFAQSDDVLLSHTELKEVMAEVMTPNDVDTFFTFIDTNSSATLWDTMVNLFGEHQWNIYTNHLMDQWWRIESSSAGSILFEQVLYDNFPVDSSHGGRSWLKSLLHRIYDYDNLQDYAQLIDQSWLPETLQWLQDGSLTIEQFAQLDIKQREIITQALFYHYPQEKLSLLFSSEFVDTSATLSRWDKILQFFEQGKTNVHPTTSWEVVVDQTDMSEMFHSFLWSLQTRIANRRNSWNISLPERVEYLFWKISPFTFPVIKRDKKMK